MRILEDGITIRKYDLPLEISDNLLSEEWAQKLHGQSLKRLNERGGMGVIEIMLNINKLKFEVGKNYNKDKEEYIGELKNILKI